MSSRLAGADDSAALPGAGLDHATLATLAREWLLGGHLIDRAGMPHVIGRFQRDGMAEIAIDEWMGASPIYTRRMQELLGFGRDDVACIFQGMQLDIGAPPEFLDFRYSVTGPDAGTFELAYCGALADVEPMGDDYVVAMCHHIEDPTFDATAVATNPRAQVRPVHRPPRVPADRHPHCAWTVRIEHDAEPVTLPAEVTVPMEATLAARTPLAPLVGPHGDGWGSYPELDPDLRTEDFSSGALRAILAEVALQGHLLSLSAGKAVERRADLGTAREILAHQLCGVAGVVAGRLAVALGVTPDLGGLATVLEHHPALAPAPYVARTVERDGDDLRLAIGPCDAAAEEGPGGWISALVGGRADDAVSAMARAVVPDAVAAPVAPLGGELAAWAITGGGDPAPEHPDVALARFSAGADFRFRRVGPR